MLRNRQKSTEKYEAKLEELKQAIAVEARGLGDVADRRDRARAEIGLIGKDKERLIRDINFLEDRVADLDRIIRARRAEDRRVEKAMAEECKRHRAAIEILKMQKKMSAKDLSALGAKVAKLKDEEKSLDGINAKVEKAKADLSSTLKEEKAVVGRVAAREEGLAMKEAEAKERREKNKAVLVQTEKNLRLIEHYVKRLQRRYDKSGVKVNLLGQFNVKRDNK